MRWCSALFAMGIESCAADELALTQHLLEIA